MKSIAIPGPYALFLFAILGWVYWPTFQELYEVWTTHPEYSHGLLVPLFSLYLLFQLKPIAITEAPKSWPILGFGLLFFGMLMRLAGAGTSFLPLEGLSFILSLVAIAMIAGGRIALVQYWQPLFFLVFMVPLPYEFSRMMGAELQKIATFSSTFLLQSVGQPAIAEGNKILIEGVTLNVVEACSGLRMLVTFIGFSVAAAMLMERHWLVKLLILASAVPIALVTNILRIAATGLAHIYLPDNESKVKIMDFIHDFNGWMMMPVGLLFLVGELWLFKHLLIERTQNMQMRTPTVAQPQVTQQPSTGRPRFSVIQMPRV